MTIIYKAPEDGYHNCYPYKVMLPTGSIWHCDECGNFWKRKPIPGSPGSYWCRMVFFPKLRVRYQIWKMSR